MSSGRNICIICAVVICVFLSFPLLALADEASTTSQIIGQVDDILKANPLPTGEKSQMIKIAEDDTISFFLIRMMPGAELPAHIHKTHDETEYVVRGSGQLLVNDKWVEFKAECVHFNPTKKVHGARNTGDEPLIVLVIFTPAMRETDRHFLK